MLRRSLRAILQYGGLLLVVVVVNFALPRLAPGTATDYILPPSQSGTLTPQQNHQLLAEFGLDKSTAVQFERYVMSLAHGDLLYSFRLRQPVKDVITGRIGWTALLVGLSIILSTLFGTVVGFRSAWKRGRSGDVAVLGSAMLVNSTPPFFVGLLLILAFSVDLHWFPIYGALPPSGLRGLALLAGGARRLVLPLVTLTLARLGGLYLVARSSLVSELREDYVLMARAKGLDARAVRRHAERNALMPVATDTLIEIGTMVGGAVVVETVFSYPGLGRLIYDSVLSRDYPVLQGVFLVLAIGVILANLAGDLLYPLLDPRVRSGGR